jgi:phospho-N-acetylmuramoyl-pentapeptide-transferase
MGDTGSMFLGGMVVALVFMLEYPIILIFAGIVYLCEAMSVVIQVAYYKKTHKRLFKMSPIHHHFELSGWGEKKIDLVFSLVGAIGGLIAMALVVFG